MSPKLAYSSKTPNIADFIWFLWSLKLAHGSQLGAPHELSQLCVKSPSYPWIQTSQIIQIILPCGHGSTWYVGQIGCPTQNKFAMMSHASILTKRQAKHSIVFCHTEHDVQWCTMVYNDVQWCTCISSINHWPWQGIQSEQLSKK